jgi:hypothetical protein
MGSFKDILLSFRRKAGRPRVVPWDEILPWDKLVRLTPEEAGWLDAMMWLHRLQTRKRRGPKADDDFNSKLVEAGDREALRQLFKENNDGRAPSEDEVRNLERQRLRIKKVRR